MQGNFNTEKIARLLGAAWPKIPGGLLDRLAESYDTELVLKAILDVGRAGQLQNYAPLFERFCRLRHQAKLAGVVVEMHRRLSRR